MFWDDELNERKMQILNTLIDDYVQTAQPVGSRTISKKYELGLSSATIRNEMADLEEMGYISQPHTSAGRVPSDKGYRFYVDHLMQAHTLAIEEIQQIRSAMESKMNEINALVSRASNIISMVTGYTAIATSPNLNKVMLKTVQIVPVDDKKALVVVVSSGGIVNNKVVRLNSETSPDILLRLSNYLHDKLNGLVIENIQLPEVEDIVLETGVASETAISVLEGLSQCMHGIEQSELIMKGTMNLLNHPEFSDLLKVREVLELFNDLDVIKAERERIARNLKERGVYYFSPDNIIVQADSTVSNDHKVDVNVKLKDDTPQLAKEQFTIDKVIVFPNYNIDEVKLGRYGIPAHIDTISAYKYEDIYVMDHDNKFKPKIFDRALYFKTGDLYNRSDHNLTLSRLINLGVFKFVKNEFVVSESA